MLWDYANFTKLIESMPLAHGLGDTKFYVDGRSFEKPWCTPQTDGAALTASVLIRFANVYLENGGDFDRVKEILYNPENSSTTAIKAALEYVVANWESTETCDIVILTLIEFMQLFTTSIYITYIVGRSQRRSFLYKNGSKKSFNGRTSFCFAYGRCWFS